MKKRIWEEEEEERSLEDADISFQESFTRGVIGVFSWILIFSIAKFYGDTELQNVSRKIEIEEEKMDAMNDYRERMELLEHLNMQGDLTKNVHNLTGVNVGAESLYQEMNQALENISTTEELKRFAYQYICKYIAFSNDSITEDDILLIEDDIYCGNTRLELDQDAIQVLRGLLMRLEMGPEEYNKDGIQIWIDDVKRQILVLELYYPVSDEKRLFLSPRKLDIF